MILNIFRLTCSGPSQVSRVQLWEARLLNMLVGDGVSSSISRYTSFI